MDEAVFAWLVGAELTGEASGVEPAGSDGATSGASEVGPTSLEAASTVRPGEVSQSLSSEQAAPEDSGVRAKAKSGHSPSARALVNASDTVARMASMAATAPPTTLRSRVLASAATMRVPTPPTSEPSGRRPPPVAIEIAGPNPMRLTSPNEIVGRMHQAASTETARQARIDSLHATGGPEDAATTRALALLLEQIAPFFDFEIVLVSAVHGERTVHRVHRGFPPELGAMDVVPRELSFCTHTVSAGEPFVVENTLSEAFFRSSVLAQRLGARAYMGVPLFSDEVALGALCAISGRPQTIREEDVAFLGRFAEVVQAFVLHDAGALAALVSASPAAAGAERIVYSPAFFRDLVSAEATRSKQAGRPAARVARLAAPTPPADLVPANVVASVDGPNVLVLVPERYPDADGLVARLRAAGAQIDGA
ncbi:MAG: GAF domain-containing protein [Polyangiaceae bacterium]|nr:GAF domain-containing protein [Polyangiaceae bacterium]